MRGTYSRSFHMWLYHINSLPLSSLCIINLRTLKIISHFILNNNNNNFVKKLIDYSIFPFFSTQNSRACVYYQSLITPHFSPLSFLLRAGKFLELGISYFLQIIMISAFSRNGYWIFFKKIQSLCVSVEIYVLSLLLLFLKIGQLLFLEKLQSLCVFDMMLFLYSLFD